MDNGNAGPQSNRLFIGNLAWATTDQSLMDAFAKIELPPAEAKVIIDRSTGRSRGFGFVTFDSPEHALMAKDRMHGQDIDGRAVRVDFANSTQRN